MVVNKVGKDIPQSYAEQYGIYEGELAHWCLSRSEPSN